MRNTIEQPYFVIESFEFYVNIDFDVSYRAMPKYCGTGSNPWDI